MRKVLPLLALALAAALVPLVPGFPPFWVTLLCYIAIFAIVAIGIVILTGVANILSFGQAMFMGIGAYTTAVLTTRYGVSPWLGLPAAILVTGILSLFVGAITLRLHGHYLAVATIAWNMSFFYLAGNLDFLRRYDGISGIPPLRFLGTSLSDPRDFWYLALAALVLVVAMTAKLLDSRIGRAVRSLRGGALAAESFGIDTYRARVFAFVYAGILAAVAGWLYAHLQRAVNPSPFSLNASIDFLLMAVAGGVGHIGGAILGAGLVTIVRDQLQGILPGLIGAQGNFEIIVFGAVLILILQFSPEGLWPHVRNLFSRRRREKTRDLAGAGPLEKRAQPQRGRPLLTVEGLRKQFGGLVAVDDIGFDIRAGEIVGLIGPNGAGKSTSFNLITGVLSPTAGAVTLAGEAISGRPARAIARRGVARTFQHVKLVHGMSVIDNVAIGAHLRGRAGPLRGILGLDADEEARLYAEARRQIARVGLAAHEGAVATDLALGQQRLVEIARALCLDPVLLLLDEPAAGLRHAEKEALAGLLGTLRAEGMAVLLVEHDMDFVMGLTDRLVVMNFGSELAKGRPAEVQANPAVIEAYLGAA
ncbi:ABC transporter permease subunit [Aureimonas populi]|uniref:ATP-binding cassette domain-containing protein n=1 Tax=Aureimonas populi TaxID=1701758 RepID=A0ABW5CIT6_9HYPH|nr:branched-chain amino acid ABC transporter ATP-binding protein/permease [Aureimonas populi]